MQNKKSENPSGILREKKGIMTGIMTGVGGYYYPFWTSAHIVFAFKLRKMLIEWFEVHTTALDVHSKSYVGWRSKSQI